MSDIGRIIGKDSASARYAETADFLQDNGILDAAHWSAEHKAYLDYGLHTERVVLERPRDGGTSIYDVRKTFHFYFTPSFLLVRKFGAFLALSIFLN